MCLLFRERVLRLLRDQPKQTMSTKHTIEFFQKRIFYINEDFRTGEKSIEEASLGEFLREFADSLEDPAHHYIIKENDAFVISEAEEEYEYSDGTIEPAKEEVTGTRWEVWTSPHRQGFRSKRLEAFETEQEADEYILNGLYWCWWNTNNNAPATADTSEEAEALLLELTSNDQD